MSCLIENCTAKGRNRGICSSHYAMISRLVRNKVRTWEEFEKAGMCKDVKRNWGERLTQFEAMAKKKGIKLK